MNLSSQMWHVRWYRFVLKTPPFRDTRYKYMNSTNLCHFIRVTVMWPVIFAIVCAAFGTWVGIVIFLPFAAWGLWGFIFYLALIVIIAAIYGAILLCGKYPSIVVPIGGMAHCIYERTKAAKQSICPLVTID